MLGGSNSDSLWIVSPFVRSIIGSLNNLEENLLIIPDFSNEIIEAAIRIIERKNKDQTEFSSEKPEEEISKQIECKQAATNQVNIDHNVNKYPRI